MGPSLSLERVENLRWLGRYVERSFTTLRFILSTYDEALDRTDGNWKGRLEELGFDQDNDDPRRFFHDALFSPDLPISIYCSMSNALDDAVVLRDVIGSESVAYVQMGLDKVVNAAHSETPLLDLQDLVDDILAFKGSCDDYILNDAARNIIKCGISVERMDLYTRLSYRLEDLKNEASKLASRLDRTGMPYDHDAFKEIIEMVFAEGFPGDADHDKLAFLLEQLGKLF